MRRPLVTIFITGLLALAAGCGSGENEESQSTRDPESPKQSEQSGEGPNALPAADVAEVLMAQDSVNTACGLTRDQQGSDIPLQNAIRTLQNIYRAGPEQQFSSGVSYSTRNMGDIIEANADTLRKCGKTAEATELSSVLES